jgi:hypothetical protein
MGWNDKIKKSETEEILKSLRRTYGGTTERDVFDCDWWLV